MKLKIDDIIKVTKPLMLDDCGWRLANSEDDPENCDYLPKCEIQLDFLYWDKWDNKDNNPGFNFKIVDKNDPNGPEFHLGEVSKFFRDGTFEIKE